MRLYNPNYGKETGKQKRAKQRRQKASTALIWLTILAAIAGLVCCIVFKVRWYYYLVDIIGGIVLLFVFAAITPSEIKKYVDIPIDQTEDEYVEQELSKITPESVMSGVMERYDGGSLLSSVSYKGIWNGIAACDCGKVFVLKNISFDVTKRSDVSTADANSNQKFYELATVVVTCHCPKCGSETETTFHNVKLPTGSITKTREMFSELTTTTTTSYKADYPGFVEKIYNEDLARHKSDCAKYEKIIMKKTKTLRQNFKSHKETMQRQIEKLLAQGWYEKSDKKVDADKICNPKQ